MCLRLYVCTYIHVGAAYARAEAEVSSLVLPNHLPFLPTPMGKGILPDTHHLCVAAARSRSVQCKVWCKGKVEKCALLQGFERS